MNWEDIVKKKKKPDFLDLDGDGDKKESMKEAAKEAKGSSIEKEMPKPKYMTNFPKPPKSLIERSRMNLGQEKAARHISGSYGQCKVKRCGATTCRSNKDMRCMLDEIYIDDNGHCQQFVRKE